MNSVQDQWSFLTQIIANLGFPIAVSIFLLISFEKRIDRLNSRISEMLQMIRDGIRGRK